MGKAWKSRGRNSSFLSKPKPHKTSQDLIIKEFDDTTTCFSVPALDSPPMEVYKGSRMCTHAAEVGFRNSRINVSHI